MLSFDGCGNIRENSLFSVSFQYDEMLRVMQSYTCMHSMKREKKINFHFHQDATKKSRDDK